jgi:RNA polymerase sigma-70 factor (ECF subfamily)
MVVDFDAGTIRRAVDESRYPDAPVARRLLMVFSEATGRVAAICAAIGRTIVTSKEDQVLPETGPAPTLPTLTLHVAALRRYAYALERDREEADDLVQDCLARAIARTKAWSEIRNVRAYLFTILHNLHVDRVSRGRNAGISVPLEAVEHKLMSHPSQEETLRLRDLERALRVLPEDYRKAVLLVGLEGMSYQEAATTLGIPIGTVMSRLSRGRETLRQLMATEARAKLRMVK